MRHIQMSRRNAVVILLHAAILLISACGDSRPASSLRGVGEADSSQAPKISVLSNRADLISGDDALIRIRLPANSAANSLRVLRNAADVTNSFSIDEVGDAIGLVEGLESGANRITATTGDGSVSAIELFNHPQGGSVIAGPQVQPWTCQPTAIDAQCNQPVSYQLFYISSTPGKVGFQPYTESSPATDVANTTTDQGITVPFIVRLETGYQDRDQYQIAALYQPGKPWSAARPQTQFNRKMLITHGQKCGVSYAPDVAPSVLYYAPSNSTVVAGSAAPAIPTEVFADTAQHALAMGFVVMSTALNNSGHNCNVVTQAESLIMAKEHVIEHYGTLRYTIGAGCSGGALATQWIANAYPGIYQGVLPTCSFPDAWSSATQALDYHLLNTYFGRPVPVGLNGTAGMPWTADQIAAVEGSISPVNAIVNERSFFAAVQPSNPCPGTTDANRYHAQTNPEGARCSIADLAINVLAPRSPDRWTDVEKKIGRGFAGLAVDNVGVQYGLSALQAGTISVGMFIDLNQKIGGLDIDANPIPERLSADPQALANAYRSGLINEANNLDQTAIIDCRGPDPAAAHDAYRAYALRARFDRLNGTHDSHLIWEGPQLTIGDIKCNLNAFIAIDHWLAATESDGGDDLLEKKLIKNKPTGLDDACYDGQGNYLSRGVCGTAVVGIYGTPRTVAGDAISTDTNKCQLKPLSRNDSYGPAVFTDAQWGQMQRLFPDGVCDYGKTGVSQQPTIPWMSYQDPKKEVVYGGRPLPSAPAFSGEGWASPAFNVFGRRGP